MREIERETRTFIFVNDTDTGGGGADAEIAEILVCGERAERRERAVRIVRERVEYSLRNPPPDRDRGRRRSRSPDAPRRVLSSEVNVLLPSTILTWLSLDAAPLLALALALALATRLRLRSPPPEPSPVICAALRFPLDDMGC